LGGKERKAARFRKIQGKQDGEDKGGARFYAGSRGGKWSNTRDIQAQFPNKTGSC
jgi:hypothetical protein